jgi:hypothetical protein
MRHALWSETIAVRACCTETGQNPDVVCLSNTILGNSVN